MKAATTLALMGAGALLLIDVRDHDEYARGRAPGSVNVPLDQVLCMLPQLVQAARGVAFICTAGHRCHGARHPAEHNGVRATNVPGGFAGWIGLGLPLHNDLKETSR